MFINKMLFYIYFIIIFSININKNNATSHRKYKTKQHEISYKEDIATQVILFSHL